MELASCLEGLREALSHAVFPIPPHAGRADRDRLVRQLDDYLIPRVESLDAPLLAVVGGSTGAGKSTVVNSLLGREVSVSSAIRPTTRRPVLLHHPDDARWFDGDRILPGLARVTGSEGSDQADLELLAVPELPRGLAVVDAPDVDSVVDANRNLADQLLQAADLWLFATTAARYADAVPWDFLSQAANRRAVVGLILNRVPPDVRGEVEDDFRDRLSDAGLADSPLFTIEEQELSDQRLPAGAVAEIRHWLFALAEDAASRSRVATQTLGGAVDAALISCRSIAIHADTQTDGIDHLAGFVTAARRDASERVRIASADGTLLRGEVLARWQEFVGTGDFLRAIEAGVGRVWDKLGAFFKGRPSPTREMEEVIEEGLASLLTGEAYRARSAVDRQWRSAPGGPELLGGLTVPDDAELRELVSERVVAWQNDLLTMIRTEGSDRRLTARVLSFGVNGLAVTLMVIIFASTGGLTGGEVATAAGAAVVGQKLLEAIFGEDAVRRMAKQSRQALIEHADDIVSWYLRNYSKTLDSLGASTDIGNRIANAATDCRAALTLMRAREW